MPPGHPVQLQVTPVGGLQSFEFRDDAYNRDALPLCREKCRFLRVTPISDKWKDASVKRGYSRALQTLTCSTPLLQIIAPEFLRSWSPSSSFGKTTSVVEVLEAGLIFQVRIPSKTDKPGGSPVKQAYKRLQSKLIHLQMPGSLRYSGTVVIMALPPTASRNRAALAQDSEEETTESLRAPILRRHLVRAHPESSSSVRDEFITTLITLPQLTPVLKGDWMGLYRSPNFDGWYRQRHKKKTQKLESLHLEDLLSWTKDKSEVEIVDLILKLREKLIKARRAAAAGAYLAAHHGAPAASGRRFSQGLEVQMVRMAVSACCRPPAMQRQELYRVTPSVSPLRLAMSLPSCGGPPACQAPQSADLHLLTTAQRQQQCGSVGATRRGVARPTTPHHQCRPRLAAGSPPCSCAKCSSSGSLQPPAPVLLPQQAMVLSLACAVCLQLQQPVAVQPTASLPPPVVLLQCCCRLLPPPPALSVVPGLGLSLDPRLMYFSLSSCQPRTSSSSWPSKPSWRSCSSAPPAPQLVAPNSFSIRSSCWRYPAPGPSPSAQPRPLPGPEYPWVPVPLERQQQQLLHLLQLSLQLLVQATWLHARSGVDLLEAASTAFCSRKSAGICFWKWFFQPASPHKAHPLGIWFLLFSSAPAASSSARLFLPHLGSGESQTAPVCLGCHQEGVVGALYGARILSQIRLLQDLLQLPQLLTWPPCSCLPSCCCDDASDSSAAAEEPSPPAASHMTQSSCSSSTSSSQLSFVGLETRLHPRLQGHRGKAPVMCLVASSAGQTRRLPSKPWGVLQRLSTLLLCASWPRVRPCPPLGVCRKKHHLSPWSSQTGPLGSLTAVHRRRRVHRLSSLCSEQPGRLGGPGQRRSAWPCWFRVHPSLVTVRTPGWPPEPPFSLQKTRRPGPCSLKPVCSGPAASSGTRVVSSSSFLLGPPRNSCQTSMTVTRLTSPPGSDQTRSHQDQNLFIWDPVMWHAQATCATQGTGL
ncbi:protein DENND6B [Lates japonicus]|uniref:Protein DENND6B n=1 Tax=Lates japonicus TaxID=270547 RepID=A0AAD3RL75_LATJO|nr:protein DENND6B [Lates japonicus]